MKKLTDDEYTTIYDDLNQSIHDTVHLIGFCDQAREGLGDRETILEGIERIEAAMRSVRQACGLQHQFIDTALRVLNEAYSDDAQAINDLVNHRTPCNQALAEHPTIQVGTIEAPDLPPYDVGIVGLLNGILEAATNQRIAAVTSDTGPLLVTGFTRYTPPEK